MGAVDKSLLLCKKLKKPSEANKRHLAKLFPSSSGALLRPKPLLTAVDPIAECVASSQQQKAAGYNKGKTLKADMCAASRDASNCPQIVLSQEVEQGREDTEAGISPSLERWRTTGRQKGS